MFINEVASEGIQMVGVKRFYFTVFAAKKYISVGRDKTVSLTLINTRVPTHTIYIYTKHKDSYFMHKDIYIYVQI